MLKPLNDNFLPAKAKITSPLMVVLYEILSRFMPLTMVNHVG